MSSILRRQIRHRGGTSSAHGYYGRITTAIPTVRGRTSRPGLLVSKQDSSDGKDKLDSISKQGDRYLRGLFTAGALAVIRHAKIHGTGHRSVEKTYESQFSTVSKSRPC
jgi:hypothetical protein